MKKILFLLTVCTCFNACNSGEIERLQKENEALKAQIAELSETEQNRFNKAIDLLNSAGDLQSYKEVEKTFSDFIQKFPTSAYITEAKRHEQTAKNKADVIEKVANAKADITSLIAQRKWGAATNRVNSIKTLIDSDEYNFLLQQIKEEKDKPEKTTIDKLASEIYDLQHSREDGSWGKQLDFFNQGKRVEIIGYGGGGIGFLNVRRKSITLYGKKGCAAGESVEVFYDKTDMVDFFLNMNANNTHCGSLVYKVIGRAFPYSNGNGFYIRAESIGDGWE